MDSSAKRVINIIITLICRRLKSLVKADDKVTTNHEYHASLLMKVLERSPQNYLLADKSKFDRSGLFKICSLKTFNEILTD